MYREINNETSSQHTRAGKNVMEKKYFLMGLVLTISAASVFYSKPHVIFRIKTQHQTITKFSSTINHKSNPTLSGIPRLPPKTLKNTKNLKNNNSPHTIAIGILTIENNFDFRQAQRNSWLRSNPTIAYKFLLDKPTKKLELENSRFHDLFYLNATFSGKARGFGEKMYIWFKYAHQRYPDVELIAKADDDVFVCGKKMQLLVNIQKTQINF